MAGFLEHMVKDGMRRHTAVVRMKRCRLTRTFRKKTAVREWASQAEADIGAGRIGVSSEAYTVAEAVSACSGDA